MSILFHSRLVSAKQQAHLLLAVVATVALCGGAHAGTARASFAVSVSVASRCSIAASPKPSVTCTGGSPAPAIVLDNGTATVTF
jgi:hypothetical protein